MCIEYIYRHIQKLSQTEIFTTREMLIYGSRSAVDAALHRMVKSCFIKRLARGVFVKDDSGKLSLFDIVKAKARAFKMTVSERMQPAPEPNDTSEQSPIPEKFAKVGHSCSFWTVKGRATIQGVSSRKMGLTGSKIGEIVLTLWERSRRFCSSADVNQVTVNLRRSEREQLWLHGSTMPSWLNKLCKHRYPPVRVV